MTGALDPGSVRGRSLPLFLECNKQGQVLWMSPSARDRLGAADNVLDGMPEHTLPMARRFLTGEEPAADISTNEFRRPGRERPIQVCFSRVLSHEDRVWLSAQVSERASDFAVAAASDLGDVQSRVVSHYFRLQQLESKLQRARRRRRSGGESLIRMLEEERARLGRELHAGVGQALAGIRVHLEIVQSRLPSPPEEVRGSLTHIGTLAEQALEQARAVAHRLHPPDWQSLDIHEAIRQLWDVTGIPQRYEAQLELPPLAEKPSPAVSALIYRMVQESISNLVRHASATRVRLSLACAGNQFTCAVEDNGTGFDVSKVMAAGGGAGAGIGLRSIRSQAAAMGGRLVVESGPSGSIVKMMLPVTQPDQEI